MPEVSVILTAYNTEQYVERCLDSVLNQTFKDFEFLITDDGSIDDTLAILEKKSAEDERIKLFKKEENEGLKGAVDNLNHMIQLACGKYIAIIDADDIWKENKLEKQVKDLQTHPDIFLLSSNGYKIDESDNVIRKVTRPTKPEESAKRIVHSNPFCHSSILFRNEGYLYRPKIYYCHDYDLYLRMFSDDKKLVHRKDFLFYYRISESQLSSKMNKLTTKLSIMKVIEFFQQREKFGKDQYESFDPQIYIQISNPEFHSSIGILRKALNVALEKGWQNDFDRVLKKAIKQHGKKPFVKFWIINYNFNLARRVYLKIKPLRNL